MNMNYKKYFRHLVTLLLFSFFTTSLFSGEGFEFDDPLDGFAFGVQGVTHDPMPTRITPTAAVDFIFDPDNSLSTVVLEHFYLRTNPLRRRSFLAQDFFQFPRYDLSEHLHMFVFFNQISKGFYWEDKTSIKDFVDITQEHAVEVLDQKQLTTIDIPEVLALFENIKAQERRFGMMFQYSRSFYDWRFAFHIPFLIQEHNFYLTKAEQKAVEENPVFKDLDTDIITFARAHLISDKLGIGDSLLSFEKAIKETDSYQIYAGIDLTVPTAFAIKKGLVGTYFDKRKKAHGFDVYTDLINPYREGEEQLAKDNGEALLLSALDRLSSVVLEHGLGNEKHFSVGLFARTTLQLFDNVTLTNKTKIEIPLPHKEWRFIREPIRQAQVDLIPTYDLLATPPTVPGSDAEALEDIAYLNELLSQKFFPTAYETNVFPGLIFQTNMKLARQGEKWTTFIGTDMWYQMKEKFDSIEVSSSTEALLDIPGAKRGYAFQNKLWFGIEKNRDHSDWNFGLVVSTTNISYGVGADFNIAFTLSREF